MTFDRLTLAKPEIRMEGKGLHSGVSVVVRLLPNNLGIRFVYGDSIFLAKPHNVTETRRCTRLGDISTVEHLMAALAGSGITDADVVLSEPELPAMDGSALPFLHALGDPNSHEKLETVELPPLFTRIFLHEGDCKLAISAGEGEWRYEFSSPGQWPEFQAFETSDMGKDFATEVAPARTFGFEKEVPAIRASGMAKGLDLEKALLIGEQGYANVPRFPDEPARHKLLDAVGDLYLSGIPIRFLNVVAERTGHRMNVLASQKLHQAVFGE